MKLITKLDQIAETAPCSLALGTFDGLHRGHMAVIHAAAAPGPGLEYWEPAVFTFESSPSGVCSVVTPRDKERLLETAGIRRLYSMRFSEVREMCIRDSLVPGHGAVVHNFIGDFKGAGFDHGDPF